MIPEFEFSTMRQLGRLFGVSSHEMGRWLVAIGLRSMDKRPSYDAFDRKFVEQAPTGRGTGYFWVWHTEKTVAALERAGYRRIGQEEKKPEPTGDVPLVGPFTARQSSVNGYEVLDANGVVGVWVAGQVNVGPAVASLNLGHDHGLFA
jgi:hypothetical protein